MRIRFSFLVPIFAGLMLASSNAFAFEALFCHDRAKGENYTLSPFFTDGCSSWLQGGGSIGVAKDVFYSHCCIVHDIAYWTGGTPADRKAADNGLYACIKQSTNPITATMILTGVRAGGLQCMGTRWRWGYGWVVRQGERDYTSDRKATALTDRELEQRREKLEAAKSTALQRNRELFNAWCAKVKKGGNKCDEAAYQVSHRTLQRLLGNIRQ